MKVMGALLPYYIDRGGGGGAHPTDSNTWAKGSVTNYGYAKCFRYEVRVHGVVHLFGIE